MLFSLFSSMAVVAVFFQATTINAFDDEYFTTYSPVTYGDVKDFQIFCYGNCNQDKKDCKTTPGVMIMGGGTDVDEAFVWQIEKAGGGDFVLLRDNWGDAYNPYIYNLSIAYGFPLNSVTTIFLNTTKGAYDSRVQTILQNAEAIFVCGGAQDQYLIRMVNTPVQQIVRAKSKTVPVGGTSAGAAIIGGYIYSAMTPISTSTRRALNNPFDPSITFAQQFYTFPYLENVLFDTHFKDRNRMGRMLTFMARIKYDYGTVNIPNLYSVGIDASTALLLDIDTGDVAVVGFGTVYVCKGDHTASQIVPDVNLTYTNVACQRLDPVDNNNYSFATWPFDMTTNNTYTLSVVRGAFSPENVDPYSGVLMQPTVEPSEEPSTEPSSEPSLEPTNP